MDNLPFNEYAANVFSQNGEDGIIEEIIKRLGIDSDAWCVEFGAWDGMHLSNTFNLVKLGWNAVYIEGCKSRFCDLLDTVKKFEKIVPINAYVSHIKNDNLSLDNILKTTPIKINFDLLSIDVDSYDLDIWESMINYSPKVVIIEINSLVPPGIVWRHTASTPGNTFTATINVAQQKNYTLICHTGNLIFVRDDLVSKLHMDERFVIYPELLFMYERWMRGNNYVKTPSLVASVLPAFVLRLIGKFRRQV